MAVSLPSGRRRRGRGVRFVLALVVFGLAAGAWTSPWLAPAHAAAAPASPRGSPAGPAGPVAVHPPGLGVPPGARPLSGHDFYTQQGASMNAVNGQSAGVSRLSETFRLASSPYPTAYELNGLSGTGDWYQIIISDNWPGCNSGFELGYETWDASGTSGPVGCDPTVSLSLGDTVRLGLNFSSSTVACMDLTDVSTATSQVVCESQPDTGASKFSPTTGTANSNGYYTGPMTEIINQTANTCPDYKLVPTLDYRWANSWWVTTYTPWSDEFDAAFGSVCYSSSGSAQSLGSGDPATYYVDTASGTSYGPHWGGGQNLTLLDSATGWRYFTDPKPVNSSVVAANRTSVSLGQSVQLTVTGTGGVGPWGGLWTVNGTFQPGRNSTWNWTPPAAGTFRVQAYLTDSLLAATLSSNSVTITVVGHLTASPLVATPSNARVDVGQLLTISSLVVGGVPPIHFSWTGLPVGCASVDAPTVGCHPTFPGPYSVQLTARDSNTSTPNGTVVSTPLLPVVVDPALTGVASLSSGLIDARQAVQGSVTVQGGRGPFTTNWSGLPAGCAASNVTSFRCQPAAAGQFTVVVTLSDVNGGLWESAGLSLQVLPAVAVGLTGSPLTLDSGQSAYLVATLSGGTGAYTVQWLGLPGGCASANRSALTCAPNETGSFPVNVRATDSIGGNATSAQVLLTVFSAPSVALSPANASVSAGGTVRLSATAGGGQPTYSFSWSGLPSGCPAPTGAELVCTGVTSGTYTVYVTVTDSLGGSATASARVTVGSAGGGGSGGFTLPGLDPVTTLIVLAAIPVVVVALVAALWRRRQGPPRVPSL